MKDVKAMGPNVLAATLALVAFASTPMAQMVPNKALGAKMVDFWDSEIYCACLPD